MDVLDLDLDHLNVITYGTGPQSVFAIVSPTDPQSRIFFESIHSLADSFTFHIVVIPYSDTPKEVVLSYTCPDNPHQAISSLFTGLDFHKIGIAQNCDPSILTNRFITTRFLGLIDVPTVIAPSGAIEYGTPSSWETFLFNNRK